MNKRIKNWQAELEYLSKSLKDSQSIDLIKFEVLEKTVMSISSYIEEHYSNISGKELKEKQAEFRKFTDSIFQQSYFFRRARQWPRGYSGDYETLEQNYQGVPIESEGIGMYLDNYFLTRTLAEGVRERKEFLSELILKELESRSEGQRILNIGCGSSREIFDIGKRINKFGSQITFLDYDEEAVNYSKLLLYNGGIDISEFGFEKYNAFKLTSVEETKSKFGKKDIIYSAGLFDYIKTDGLLKMIHSLYSLLDEGGVIIAPFKDRKNYGTFDYHWLGDWAYFYQGTIEDVTGILEKASGTKVEIIPSGTSAINFFILRK
jgi:SAM-dependent methyltransferase